jgi:hypothetical protein
LQFTRPKLSSFQKQETRLIADPILVDKWRDRLEKNYRGRLIVGFCWRSGIISYTRRREYFTLKDWMPVLDVEDTLFVNLQYYGQDEIRRLISNDDRYAEVILDIQDADLKDDFEVLAALIECCALVISSPTNILEYAGILGKESWMVTASSSLSANWRIVSEDGRDAWFRSVKHYSALKLGGKEAVIRCVRDDLNSRSLEFQNSHEA